MKLRHCCTTPPKLRRFFATRTSNKDPSRLNVLLTSHIRANDSAAALHLFHGARRSGARVDSYTFPPILAASSSVPDLTRQLHALMVLTGCDAFPIPATALLDSYSKSNHPSDARQVFDEMPQRDAAAYNTLISCLSRNNLPSTAIAAFRSMVADGVVPTGFVLCSALKACTLSRSLQQGKQVHARVTVIGDGSVVVGTGLIDLYSNCGVIEDAVAVFGRLDCWKDAAVYNALVSGCVRNRMYGVAFSLLREMNPNAIALMSVLSACLESSSLQYGKQIHCETIRRGFDSDTILCNALVDMYAKCGVIGAARLVFDRIREKNVISWTSMINAYGSHGYGAEAVQLFKKMEKGGSSSVSPNDATFLSVISACGHSGLVDEGRECFFSMRDKHRLDPSPEHYACVIDMLGRSHRIAEAWELFCGVRASDGKVTSAVCVAMLNACKVNLDMVRGEDVASHLLKLDPDNSSSYILISNFYAAVGRWDVVEELRRLMCAKGLRKDKGTSQIAFNSCV